MLIGNNVFEILDILDAKAKFGRIRIVGQHIDNSSGEREHHFSQHLHLAFRFVAAPKDLFKINVYLRKMLNDIILKIGVNDFMKSDGQGNCVTHANCQRRWTS